MDEGIRLLLPPELGELARSLAEQCGSTSPVTLMEATADMQFADRDVLLLAPGPPRRGSQAPDGELGAFVTKLRQAGLRRLLLLSSAQVYGACHRDVGMADEQQATSAASGNALANHWRGVESAVKEAFGQDGLVILRPAAWDRERDPVLRILRRRVAFRALGFDPCVQVSAVADLAAAILKVAATDAGGVFNVAPASPATYRTIRRAARAVHFPVWQPLRRLLRWLPARLGWCEDGSAGEFLRHNATVSASRLREAFGLGPGLDTMAALGFAPHQCDPYGMDPDFIHRRKRPYLEFLHSKYWRTDVVGLESFPRHGGAILVAIHRGFMPLDGVMLAHILASRVGRIPRFLIHPALVKMPLIAPTMQRLGGVIASARMIDDVLQDDEVLGFFPEGILGAFTFYDKAHEVGRFVSDEFVRAALRNRVPIVPCVTLGSAEIFPIFGRIKWRWFKRWTEWPCLPITPTFPFLPVPLPSKWHTHFLPPIHIEERYPAEAADDPQTVREISQEVRTLLQAQLSDMRARRPHIFFGSLRQPDVPVAIKQ